MFADRRIASGVGFLAVVAVSPLGAQVAPGAVRAAPAVEPHSAPSWSRRAWVGAGFGFGTPPRGAYAGLAAAWYSVGNLALGARLDGVGIAQAESRSNRALLVGARTPGDRAFLLGAGGVTRMAFSHSCDAPCAAEVGSNATAFAYSVEAHGNLDVLGLALVMFGARGPARVRYNAFAITFNAGWFGP